MKQEKNIKRNVPNLRFPEFDGEWKEYKLKDIAIVANSKVSGSGIINFISTENILQNFGGATFNNTSKPSSATSFKIGDVLLSNIRPYLKKVYFADVDGGCSNDVLVFRRNGKCESLYLYYIIANNNFIDYAMQGAKGVKMPRGDREQMLSYCVHLPSKQEQQKTATLLSLLDDRISTQMKIIEKLESQIKGLYSALDRHKWKMQRLKDLFEVRSERNVDLHPVFSVAVSKGLVNQVEHLGRSFAAKDTSNYNVVRFGDIVYTKSPTGSFPLGIIKQSNIADPVAVSPLYGVYKTQVITYCSKSLYLTRMQAFCFFNCSHVAYEWIAYFQKNTI